MKEKQNSGRIKNSVRSIGAGMIYRLVNMLLPFILRSVMIQTLGVKYLGFNSLFSSILNVLNLTEFGFASAITYKMYTPAAEKDYETLSVLLTVYKRIYQIIGLLILGIGLIITPFIPKLITGDYPSEINIYIIFLVYLLNTVLSYMLFAYRNALFTAFQRLDIQSSISTFVILCTNVFQIVSLLVFKNYYLFIMIMPLFTLINNLVVAVITKRKFPEVHSSSQFDMSEFLSAGKKAGAMFGHKLNYVIVSSADSIIISAVLGLVILAKYSNYYTILSAVIGVVDTVIQALLPSVGNLLVEGDNKKSYSVFRMLSFAQFWFVGWCSICLVCLYQPFMKIWMGDNMLLDMGTVILFAMYLYAYKGRAIVLLYKDAAGMWKEDWLKPYVSGMFNILTNIILVQFLGVWGVLISTVVSFALINFLWETKVLFINLFKCSVRPYIIMTLYYLIVNGVLCVVTYLICNTINLDGVISLVLKMIVCVIVPNIIFVSLNSKRDEFKEILDILMRVKG